MIFNAALPALADTIYVLVPGVPRCSNVDSYIHIGEGVLIIQRTLVCTAGVLIVERTLVCTPNQVQSEGALRTAMESLNEYIVFCRETAAKVHPWPRSKWGSFYWTSQYRTFGNAPPARPHITWQ